MLTILALNRVHGPDRRPAQVGGATHYNKLLKLSIINRMSQIFDYGLVCRPSGNLVTRVTWWRCGVTQR